MSQRLVIMLNYVIVCGLLVHGSVYAGIGAFENVSNFMNTGTIAVADDENIVLAKENLQITIVRDTSNVQALYTFVKTGKSNPGHTITCKIPVDFQTGEQATDKGADAEEFCKFTIKYNNKALPVKTFYESVKAVQSHFQKKQPAPECRRKWFTTTFIVPDRDTFELAVHYTVLNRFADYTDNEDLFKTYSKRSFSYNLPTPSGLHRDVTITVDARSIVQIDGTVHTGTFGFIQKEPGVYTFSNKEDTSDVNNCFTIMYEDTLALKSHEFAACGRQKPKVAQLKASDSLDGTYGAENLFDNELATLWVPNPQKHGIGSWVQCSLKYDDDWVGSMGIINIGILCGCYVTEEDWQHYCRPKKLAIQVVASRNYITNDRNTYTDTVSLPAEPVFHASTNNNFVKNLYVFSPYNADIFRHGRIYSLKITILDVWPGAKNSSAALSKLFLY